MGEREHAPMTAAGSCLASALDYARHRLSLIPLIPHGKVPDADLLPRNKRGNASWKLLAARRAGEAEIREWFAAKPQINIGIITGEASGGLVVADLDAPAPREWHRPVTPTARSGRGQHLYFRTSRDVGCQRLLTMRGREVASVRGNGGYIVAPPSVHPGGSIYGWYHLLAPEDLRWEFAAAPAWLLTPPARSTPARPGEVSNESPLLTSPGSGVLTEALQSLVSDEGTLLAVCERLGIPASAALEVGTGFCCVLPKHPDHHPSASLCRGDNGMIVYTCWHTGQRLRLGEVLAAQLSGRVECLPTPSLATWTLRLFVDAGLLSPATVPVVELPTTATVTQRRVYEGFRLLLGCKWLYAPSQPSAFSWSFASAWCGVSERLVGDAIKFLLGRGYMLSAGRQRRGRRDMAVFLPGSTSDAERQTRRLRATRAGGRQESDPADD